MILSRVSPANKAKCSEIRRKFPNDAEIFPLRAISSSGDLSGETHSD